MKFLNSDYSKGYANFRRTSTYDPKQAAADKAIRDKATSPTYNTRRSSSYDPVQAAADKKTREAAVSANSSQKKGIFGKAKDKALSLKPKAQSMLKKAGAFASKNKVGVGLAAAGALGATGVAIARKMRADKGKKRGQYSK